MEESVKLLATREKEAAIQIEHEIEIALARGVLVHRMHVTERLARERCWPVFGPEELVLDEEAARLIYLEVLLERIEGGQE